MDQEIANKNKEKSLLIQIGGGLISLMDTRTVTLVTSGIHQFVLTKRPALKIVLSMELIVTTGVVLTESSLLMEVSQ